MTILYTNDSQLTEILKDGIIATVGFFDGVHLGHRSLIGQLKELAKKTDLPSAVITFPVHPRKILQSDYQPELLTSFEEKVYRLSTTGIDYCIVVDFTKDLSELSAQTFIHQILFSQFHVKALLVGYDHKFGKNRVDGFEQYKQYGNEIGMKIIQAQALEMENIHLSSTTIRKMLIEGNVKDANQILSYNYQLEGMVVGGNRMGREMGFPTANINLTEKEKIVPKEGIYAVFVLLEGKRYKGMLYIGTRPTLFNEGESRIEVNIFDFSGSLYGKNIIVEFVHYLRDDIKFQFVEDLTIQLQKDKEMSLDVLNQIKN